MIPYLGSTVGAAATIPSIRPGILLSPCGHILRSSSAVSISDRRGCGFPGRLSHKTLTVNDASSHELWLKRVGRIPGGTARQNRVAVACVSFQHQSGMVVERGDGVSLSDQNPPSRLINVRHSIDSRVSPTRRLRCRILRRIPNLYVRNATITAPHRTVAVGTNDAIVLRGCLVGKIEKIVDHLRCPAICCRLRRGRGDCPKTDLRIISVRLISARGVLPDVEIGRRGWH